MWLQMPFITVLETALPSSVVYSGGVKMKVKTRVKVHLPPFLLPSPKCADTGQCSLSTMEAFCTICAAAM